MTPKVKYLRIAEDGRIARLIERGALKNSGIEKDLELEFGDELNVFVGRNASGKTLLLKLISFMDKKFEDIEFWNNQDEFNQEMKNEEKAVHKRNKYLRVITYIGENYDSCRDILAMNGEEYSRFSEGKYQYISHFNTDAAEQSWTISKKSSDRLDIMVIEPKNKSCKWIKYYHFGELLGEELRRADSPSLSRMVEPTRQEDIFRFYYSSRGSDEKPTFSQGKYLLESLERILTKGYPICCFDEIDAGVDPDNQKRVAELLTEAKGQIFLAVHSPVILNALPNNTVVYDLSSKPVQRYLRSDLDSDMIYKLTGYDLS